MLIALVVMHLQAVLVPLGVALRCRGWLLKAGFCCFALASLAEMVDHTTTNWIYVNHISVFNGVFYGSLAAGLALLTASVSRSRQWRLPLLLLTLLAITAYPLAGKTVAIALQTLLVILMLLQWWKRFSDRRLWLYPLFGVVLTTGAGAMLTSSGDPLWHLVIGPCGSPERADPRLGMATRHHKRSQNHKCVDLKERNPSTKGWIKIATSTIA